MRRSREKGKESTEKRLKLAVALRCELLSSSRPQPFSLPLPLLASSSSSLLLALLLLAANQPSDSERLFRAFVRHLASRWYGRHADALLHPPSRALNQPRGLTLTRSLTHTHSLGRCVSGFVRQQAWRRRHGDAHQHLRELDHGQPQEAPRQRHHLRTFVCL